MAKKEATALVQATLSLPLLPFGEFHHFRRLNIGRSHPNSWGNPIDELAQKMRLGYLPEKGTIAAHRFSDVGDRLQGCTVEAALAEREALYASLLAEGKPYAATYRALCWNADGTPIVPTYLAFTCHRRTLAAIEGIRLWQGDNPTKGVNDYLFPVNVLPFISEEVTIQLMNDENDDEGRRRYSDEGLLELALYWKAHGRTGAALERVLGSQHGVAQKFDWVTDWVIQYPSLKIESRCLAPEDTETRGEGKAARKVKVYRPGGHIPLSKVRYQQIQTLLGEMVRQGKRAGEYPWPSVGKLMQLHNIPVGSRATDDVCEEYIRTLIEGSFSDKPTFDKSILDSYHKSFSAFPNVEARVFVVLDAILNNNTAPLADVLQTARSASVRPTVIAPDKQTRKSKSR